MSIKPFISAEEHLAKLGFTVQQAFDFIFANVGQPEVIYSAARENGVTNAMLSEITNVSKDIIHNYFAKVGKDSTVLDYTSILINFDLGSLETLVEFNNNAGILSNLSLDDAVGPLLIEELALPFFYKPYRSFQAADEVYDAEELGVGHLSDVPATDESIKSLFYGTLINMYETIDKTELDQIKTFPEDGDFAEFQSILLDAFSDVPATVAWSDEELANLVVEEAVETVNKLFNFVGDSELVGVLDHTFLGVAVSV
ncbi:MAG: hypothetical protein KDF59_01840 [Nitrosomonas sp.]|nr:hypothetical protein [Nitrosomonas sp.]